MFQLFIKHSIKKQISLTLSILMLAMLILPSGWVPTVKAAGTPEVVAAWNFPNAAPTPAPITSTPTNPLSLKATSGTNGNMSDAMLTLSTTVNRVVTFTTSNATIWTPGWDVVNGYWQIKISTTGYDQLTLSSKSYGNSTAPKDFKIQYSINGTDFKSVTSSVYDYAQGTGITQTVDKLGLPSEANNQPNVYIRWVNNTTASIGGGAISAGSGNSRIADISIMGVPLSTVTANPDASKINLTSKTAISGSNLAVGAMATVNVYDAAVAGTLLGSGLADSNGAFNVTLTGNTNSTVYVSAIKSPNSESARVPVLFVDTSLPVQTVKPDASKITFNSFLAISGANATVGIGGTVKVYSAATGGNLLGTAIADANGAFNAVLAGNTNTTVYVSVIKSPDTESDRVPVNLLLITKIKDLRGNDENGKTLNENKVYTVEAVVTAKNKTLGTQAHYTYIQDETGGINLFGTTFPPSFQAVPGDIVRVTGHIVWFSGIIEISPDKDIEKIGTAAVPSPVVMTVGGASTYATAEPLEGSLVQVRGKITGIGTVTATGANYTLTGDDGKAMTVRVVIPGPGIETDLTKNPDLKLNSTYTIIGVLSQSGGSGPTYFTGYQILPRTKADIFGHLILTHQSITEVYKGLDVLFSADAQSATAVNLHYKAIGDSTYTNVPMTLTTGTNYSVTLPKASIPNGSFVYYIDAQGASGQVANSGTALAPLSTNVVDDIVGPTYSKFVPGINEKTESTLPDISFSMADPSGVDQTSVIVKVDGVVIPSSYVHVLNNDVAVELQNVLNVGIHVIKVSAKDTSPNTNLSEYSWNIEVIAPFAGGNHYRGTTHNHTNISHDAAGNPEDALVAAKKYKYDWFAFSDHSHDIDAGNNDSVVNAGGMTERTGGTDWKKTKDLSADKSKGGYTENGKFVVFPAFEMTSTTWGHSNVFGSSNFIDRLVNGGAYQKLSNYYAWVLTNDNIVAQFNHPAMSANAFDNFIPYDKNVDKLFTMLEVGNGSGHYGYANADDKFYNALDLGWHVAPTYGEDNHDGTWGQTLKRTVIVAKDLSQESLLDSMKNMHVYMAEDPNFTLDVKANNFYMGSIVDMKQLSFDISGSDPVSESPSKPEYNFLPKSYVSNDNIAKVELISNGGRVIDSYVPTGNTTSFTWNPSVTVAGGQQWFVVKVTQKDGERVYSAPIWSKVTATDIRVSGIQVTGDAITGGTPATITALVSNLGKSSVSNVDAHLYYDTTGALNPTPNPANKIGDVHINQISAKSIANAAFTWANPIPGDIKFIVVVDNIIGDDNTADNKYVLPFKIKAPLGITVLIDAFHANENSTLDTGTYKDNLKAFTRALQMEGYWVKENKATITSTTFSSDTSIKVLVLTQPSSTKTLSTAEQQAVADFVKAGGSLMLTAKSNNSAGSTSSNDILASLGSIIRINNDSVYDDSKSGNFWGDPQVSLYAVKAYPKLFNNYITDGASTLEYYSGPSLYKAGTPGEQLKDSDSATIIVKANTTSYQFNSKSDTVFYNTTTNRASGAEIPLVAIESIGLGRILVSGMNFFNDKQMDMSFNYKGNESLAKNGVKWLTKKQTVVTTIGDARKLAPGTDVVIQGKITTAAGVFYDALYVQDETGGIMAFNSVPEGSKIFLGDTVRIYGHIKEFENNIELEFDTIDNSINKVSSGTPLDPIVKTTKDATSVANQGLLVQVEGKVTSIDDGSYYLDDGTGPVLVFVDGYIAIQSKYVPAVKVGDTLKAIGLSGAYDAGVRIRVRNTNELVVTTHCEDSGLCIKTASDIAAGISSVTAPSPDATTLTLPTVPSEFTVAIKSSDNTAVIKTDGTIIPSSSAVTVTLVLEVTRTSDGTKASTGNITVVVPAKKTASGVAGSITSIVVLQDATTLTLPTVPAGFTVAIKSSDNTAVIKADGTIIPPSSTTTVTLVLEVTKTSDSTKASTGNITVVVPAKSISSIKATLTGDDHVVAGGSFDLTFGLSNVTSDVYAQDITITYDPTKVDFISVDSLRSGYQVVDTNNTPGQIRFITVSFGDTNATNSNLLLLHWKAKSTITQLTNATITITDLVVADGRGVESRVTGTSRDIQINAKVIVDKSILSALIGETQSIYDLAVVGTKIDQYPAVAKANLLTAINSAKSISNNQTAAQLDVDQAVTALNSALQTFRASVIKPELGDLNRDGKISIGDLAIVVNYYGKTSADSNWNTYKIADVNNDGKVDLIDLATVASKILNTN